MNNIDLKLLAAIDVLEKTRSVSIAAKRLGVSQSAVSMMLAKLRDHFHDPLFVRTSEGMETTPYGAEIIGHLKKAEEILQSVLGHHLTFVPLSDERTFQIHSADISQITLIPRLMRRLHEIAPGLRIKLERISEDTPRLLESGEADLAIGFLHPMGGGFYQQKLFKERFLCAVRADHPRVRDSLTLERFQNEDHLEIATRATGHAIVRETLETLRIQRKIGLTVPSFLGTATILTETDLLAMVPAQLGQHLAGMGNVRLFELPVEIPAYWVSQDWHERYNHDPANKWLRSVVADLFLETAGKTNGAPAFARPQSARPPAEAARSHGASV